MGLYKLLLATALMWRFLLETGLTIAVQFLGNDHVAGLYILGAALGLLAWASIALLANLALNAILRIDHAIFNR